MASRLLEEPPVKVEVRAGLVFFTHTGGEVYVQPVNAALHTAHAVITAVDEWTRSFDAEVVRFRSPKH